MPVTTLASDRAVRDPETVRTAWFLLLAGALVVGAWLALAWWSASPYSRYVTHGGYLGPDGFAALCRAVPLGGFVVPALLHAAAWMLMITAMMLPTTLPLVMLFRQIVRGRDDHDRLIACVIAGYFVAWLAFGLAAHLADLALDTVAERGTWFVTHGYWVGAAILAGAGLFQFSALKYRCLEECRSPFTFVAARWHGRAPSREAFRLGLDHGIFCVGCCWALMLCMFVVGTGSIGWMLALAALMAAEKNLRGGSRLRLPVGLGLLGAAGTIVVAQIG